MKMRIRKFRETDLQDVFHLFIEGFEEDPTFEKSPHIKSAEDFKGYFGQTVNRALGGFLIAESDGEVLGFTLSFPVRILNSEQEDLGRIQWVVVDRKYRRKGIGCRLVRESLKYLASKRVKTVVASTWSDNTASINLLRKCGFEKDVIPEEIHFKIAVKDLQAKTKAGIIIRKAKKQDAEKICEIGGWKRKMFEDSSDRIIVAEIEGKATGFIDPFIEQRMKGRFGFFCLHVDPKNGRRGIGTTLAKAAFQHFGKNNVDQVYALTTSDNIPAINFLKKLNFGEIGRSFTLRRAIV